MRRSGQLGRVGLTGLGLTATPSGHARICGLDVVADAQAITLPTQLLISGADWVVHHGPQHAFFHSAEL